MSRTIDGVEIGYPAIQQAIDDLEELWPIIPEAQKVHLRNKMRRAVLMLEIMRDDQRKAEDVLSAEEWEAQEIADLV